MSITVLIAAILTNVIFAILYTRTVRGLVGGGLEAGENSFLRVCFVLRDDIQVVVWKALPWEVMRKWRVMSNE